MTNSMTDNIEDIVAAKLTPEEVEQMEKAYKDYQQLFVDYHQHKEWIAPIGGADKQEKAFGGRLERWSVDPHLNRVWGNLYDDPNNRFGKDGTLIHTSYIVDVIWDKENQRAMLETRNTLYELGEKMV